MRIDKKVIVGVSFILATLLGNGALWQYGQHRIEKQKIEIESEKIGIMRISETTKIREKQNNLFYKITKLAKEYQDILLDKVEGKNKIGSLAIKQKIDLLKRELDFLINDFDITEQHLAKLDNRQPRKIDLPIRQLPPPTSITIR